MTGTPLRQPLCLKVAGGLREAAAGAEQPPPSASPADVQLGRQRSWGRGSGLFGNGNGWSGRGRTLRPAAGLGEGRRTNPAGRELLVGEGLGRPGPPGSCQLQRGVGSSENGGTRALCPRVEGDGLLGKGVWCRELPRGSRKDTEVPTPTAAFSWKGEAQRWAWVESRVSRVFQFGE